jgi:hypothetical protein
MGYDEAREGSNSEETQLGLPPEECLMGWASPWLPRHWVLGVACSAAVAAWAGAKPNGAAKPVEPLRLSKPLIAYWTFDEDLGEACHDSSGNGNDASPERDARLTRVEGVFGNAMSFAGRHKLRVPGRASPTSRRSRGSP